MKHLGGLSRDAVEYGPIRRLAEPALASGFLVMLVPHAEAFGAKVECITKGFMNALQGIPTGHEYLSSSQLDPLASCQINYPLKCSRASPWMGRDEDRFIRHGLEVGDLIAIQ